MAQAEKQNVEARLNYQLVKSGNPQILIDPDGEVGKRVEPEFDNTVVALHDVRVDGMPSFQTHGIEFRTAPSQLSDFDNQNSFRAVYDCEVENLIKEVTGASDLVIFDHTLRTDDNSVRRPARHVHGDYSARSGPSRLHDVLDENQATQWERGHYGIINVWRPVNHSVQTAPLAFAEPDTVDANDWTDIDLVYPHRRGQITGLKRNGAHRWIYMSNMTPQETVVFTTFDSMGKPPVAHSAADLLITPQNAKPRQSIETRALVRFS
ncbi:hypothetical protein PsAD2_03958 [Pseudovibrio axinellae]|uniref:Methyltransferase n=1 Tax=Pseudovibrio axinellae TaxID=989403 RepID=A0A161V414_9HYPH|nr:CmcJ/NvfI family oxidoreductase [Pseudovibrio axinellae]KZL12652.1 hypothetical protein PsAD2_03958 [Pseudovibrio axinellae]SEP62879.1 hypothetical protein SAMN05421798_10122 [Pseudovibrio axinellae]